LIEKHSVFHLLVLDAQQKYRGMLSVTDMLKVITSDEKERADLLESIIFPHAEHKQIFWRTDSNVSSRMSSR
jgi:hypothetical protein